MPQFHSTTILGWSCCQGDLNSASSSANSCIAAAITRLKTAVTVLHVRCRVLYGDLHVKSYDWNDSQSGATSSTAKLVLDEVIDASSGPAAIFPASGGNIHQFTAMSDCAVLDILAPPYSPHGGQLPLFCLQQQYCVTTKIRTMAKTMCLSSPCSHAHSKETRHIICLLVTCALPTHHSPSLTYCLAMHGWHQRHHLHNLTNDAELSMADVQETCSAELCLACPFACLHSMIVSQLTHCIWTSWLHERRSVVPRTFGNSQILKIPAQNYTAFATLLTARYLI